MKILTADEMGAADRRSVKAGVPVATLMENAGAAVARFCARMYPVEENEERVVVVLCGKGNNGGDGMVAARHLVEAGCEVRLVLLGKVKELKKEPGIAFDEASHWVDEVVEDPDETQLREALADAWYVVDAVVGTGFKPPLRGLAAVARDVLAEMTVPVVAVDLPSGWDADSVQMQTEGAFRASAVVTFVAPKLAHVFGALTAETFGPVVVAGIGEPEGAVESATGLHWCGAAKAVAEVPRGVDGNKGKFGHVMILGGAFGKAGAPSMASVACLRAGAGLVTAAVPREILAIVAGVAPELMLTPLAQGADGGLSMELLEEDALAALVKGITLVGIGPGLGQAGSTPEFVREFVRRVELPMVIDADALNALAGRTALLHEVIEAAKAKGRPRTIVLTPHPGEMARLLGMSVPEVEADRVGLARRFATEHGVTLVLKGWRTLVAHPDGSVGVNTTGNPSMAKGGSGDILTGIVSAMVAQYGGDPKGAVLKPEDVAQAVEAAVFLHGLAGDFACLAQDEHTVLASDTVGHLWEAFRARVTDGDGLTWIAGTAKATTLTQRARG
jgi:NAD(P)H-hydrate epimerase